MLGVHVNGRKLPPYATLDIKKLPQEQVPAGTAFRTEEKGWMTEEFMPDWLKLVWRHWPGTLLGHRGVLILDAFVVTQLRK